MAEHEDCQKVYISCKTRFQSHRTKHAEKKLWTNFRSTDFPCTTRPDTNCTNVLKISEHKNKALREGVEIFKLRARSRAAPGLVLASTLFKIAITLYSFIVARDKALVHSNAFSDDSSTIPSPALHHASNQCLCSGFVAITAE